MRTRTVSLGIAFAIWLMALVTPLSANPTNNAVKVVRITSVFGVSLIDVEFSGSICDVAGLIPNLGHLVSEEREPGNNRSTDDIKALLSILLAAKLSSRDVIVSTYVNAFDGDFGCRIGGVTLR
jgi:hypothetical protein